MASRSGMPGRCRIGQRSCDRAASHPDAGSGVRHRPVGRNAIRALSPAVNVTFTALTCIDWPSARLSEISSRVLEEGVYRGRSGSIRLVEFDPSYARMVDRAFDKVRQAGRAMPAVIIRMIDALAHSTNNTTNRQQRSMLLRQAEMIMRAAEGEADEPLDLADFRVRYDQLIAASRFLDAHDGLPPVEEVKAVPGPRLVPPPGFEHHPSSMSANLGCRNPGSRSESGNSHADFPRVGTPNRSTLSVGGRDGAYEPGGATARTPAREIVKPLPEVTVHVTPEVVDRHRNGPSPVALP